MAYVLPCSACGQQHRVTTGDAGQWLRCACGAQIEVPTVRGLRGLAEVRDTAERTRQWTARHGVALVGILTALAGLAFGLYVRFTVPPPDFSFHRMVGEMKPAETWELWSHRFRHKIGTWEIKEGPTQQQQRRRYEQAKITQYISYGIAAAGLLTALAGWTLLKPLAAAPPKRTSNPPRSPSAPPSTSGRATG